MKKFILFTGLALCTFNASLILAQPSFSWARNIGGSSGEQAESIAVDANGNVYSTGSFQGNPDLDPGIGFAPVTSAGAADAYISKLDASGNFVWGKSFGSTANDIGYAIAVDATANVYVSGYFTGTVDFDPGAGTYTIAAFGSSDIFVLKLDAAGNFLWAKQMGGSINDEAQDLAIDNAGNIYTTGFFNNTADFDPGTGTYTLTSTGQGDIFVSKLDANGNFVWAKNMGNANNEIGYAIAVDAAQNVYTTGNFFMSSDFDPGPLTYNISIPGNGTFISKLDMNGDFVWAKAFSGNSSTGKCIKTDNANNVYTTGYFESIVDFDPGAGTYTLAPGSIGQGDAFVSKLDPSGNFLWANSMGSTGYDVGSSLALDAAQNVYATGYFENTVDFDPGAGTYTLVSAGSQDLFISKFNSLGNLVWAYNMGGSSYDQGSAITVDASYNIFTTGYFSGIVDLDPTVSSYTLTSTGSGDVFIQKLDQCVAPSAPANTTPSVNLLICQGNTTTLTASASGTISWYASSSSTLALGSGTSFVTSTLAAGTYTYYTGNNTCTVSAGRTPVIFTVSACTGINEMMVEKNVNLYPNPVNDQVHVSIDNYELQSIKIYNTIGEIAFEKDMRDQNSKLDVSFLNRGIYFIEMQTNAGCTTKKLIKQ